MRIWRHLWNDIKQGQSIDLYVTVVAAIVLTVLYVFGRVDASILPALNIALLALLANALLANRHRVEDLCKELKKTTDDVLLKAWPSAEIIKDLQEAKDLLLIGVSLRRTIKDSYALLEERLQKGCAIRILLVDPGGTSSEIAGNRVYGDIDLERTRNNIRSSIKSLCNLKGSSNGKLEIRMIDIPLALGGIIVDGKSTEGVLYIEYYTFRTRDPDVPKMAFRRIDKYWYEFYLQQAEVLWDSGTGLKTQAS